MATHRTDTYVEELVRRIRSKLRRPTGAAESPIAPLQQTDWSYIAGLLGLALERGQLPPPRIRPAIYQSPFKWLGAILARAVRHFNREVARQQEDFNTSTVQTMTLLRDTLAISARNLVQLHAHVATLTSEHKSIDRAIGEIDARQADLERQVAAVTEALARLADQERRLATILDNLQHRAQEPLGKPELQALAEERTALDDAWYVAFEDRFRGSLNDIRQRVLIYLPFITQAGAGSFERPVLDLGCGRGESLDVLLEQRLQGRGVDINRAMVNTCRERGLEVTQSDVIRYLALVPDNTVGATLALHIIEHLTPGVMVRLFDEILRVLAPGGVAIFETPNPENVIVGTNSFYLDPTHRNPLPSETVRFLAEQRGFVRVEVLLLRAPSADHHIQETTEVAARFNRYFYGPVDYAVVAWKL